MNNNPNQPVSSPGGGTPDTEQAGLIARRRLLRGSLSIAPVLMVSAPRSVMAGGAAGVCVPASSFASINASRPDLQFSCSGRTPGYWKQPQWFGQWPAPYVPDGSGATTFDAVFGAAGGYPGKTLLQVLELPGNDMGRDALARHIVAALLNAAKGLTPPNVLSVAIVKAVWSAFVLNGYYEPTAGIKWYPDYSVPAGSGGLIAWLKSTMPV
ncbi:MAG TPA: hypothetical protein VN277_05065 [Acidiferrobacterales bacterium]|nr:hypothetical protein [Acidiferrobacterales bacterium]